MRNIGILFVALLFSVLGAKSLSDADLSLRKAPIDSESNVKLKDFKYSDKMPGESKVIERSFENAPPMIPHDIEGMDDFTQSENQCMTCHSVETATGVGATSVPKSHMFDLRNSKAVGSNISDSRWNCTQCHAPQAQLKPLVGNKFKPEFRNKNGNKKSNLLEVLNDGVSVK